MDYMSHSIGGALTGLGVGYISTKAGIDCSVGLMLVGGVIGGLLADIDHPKSYVGSKVRLISDMLYSTVGHRTLTHSLLFVIVAGSIVGLFNISLGVGVALGILSHIVLDMLTGSGVAYLYPFQRKRIKWFKVVK